MPIAFGWVFQALYDYILQSPFWGKYFVFFVRLRYNRRIAHGALAATCCREVSVIADILKITTPLVNRAQASVGKPTVEPETQFNLQDVSRVAKPNAQAELLQQNNGLTEQENTPALLMNLLKDPSVTVSFLRNIFLLQEVVKLLPANNNPVTQEIEQLFQALMVPQDAIAGEMQRQEQASSAFKGEMFDFLRELVGQNPRYGELHEAVANLLKAVNHMLVRRDVLSAVGNSLSYLAQELEPSRALSTRLRELAAQFQSSDAGARFELLKKGVLEVFRDIENSILYSPKLSKVLSITVYNLSRYNDNNEFFQQSVSNLLMLLPSENLRGQFARTLEQFMRGVGARQPEQPSRIMDVLTQIIGLQAQNEELSALGGEKVERIIHSLLSSPCNFTPLLHFVVPAIFEDTRAFAEMWINPNGQEDQPGRDGEGERAIHMLVVCDVEGAGRFELELYVRGEVIDLGLFCPPAFAEGYQGLAQELPRVIRGLPYKFGNIQIDKLERPRSLVEVFRSLPNKRTGVDVKV